MNLQTVPRSELIVLIVALQQENKELKKRIAQLERKTPPDLPFHLKPSIKTNDSNGKKRKARLAGFARKRNIPTEVIRHAYSHCPDCGDKLYQGWLKKKRQVIDLPLAPATITEHQVFAHWCSSCKHKVYPQLDLSNQVLGNHRVSLRLMAFIATLKEQERKPVSEIQAHLRRFYNLNLSLGEIIEICHTVAIKAKPIRDGLLKSVKTSPTIFADETGWRENGINSYLWNFSTPSFKYLIHRKSRSKQVVKEVIGDDFEGTLVSDFYAAYNTHLGFHQRCWVHLLRDVKKLLENNPDDKQLQKWAKSVINLYQKAKTYSGPDPGKYEDARSQQQQRWKDQQQFRDQLLILCRLHLNQGVPQKTLCQRIDKYQDELFMFVADPRVPADNNAAERSLRHSVIARKISGGTRSAKGSETKTILASLFGTWKLQSKNCFQECLSLLTAASTGSPAYQISA